MSVVDDRDPYSARVQVGWLFRDGAYVGEKDERYVLASDYQKLLDLVKQTGAVIRKVHEERDAAYAAADESLCKRTPEPPLSLLALINSKAEAGIESDSPLSAREFLREIIRLTQPTNPVT